MATRSLHATHPLSSLSPDSELALVLQLEDPALMDLHRLESLIERAGPGDIRSYLFGLYDLRRAVVYAVGH